MAKLAPLLARRFTVYTYDRRGRGHSGDVRPYAREREVDDIAALVQAAGGSAHLLGLSSGGALALEAAASGVDVKTVIVYEPPYVDEGAGQPSPDHESRLQAILDAGDRGGAVAYFMRDMVGAPRMVLVMLRLMPWIWRKLQAVAHTLPYDAAVMRRFRVPAARFAGITAPTLVLHGAKTDARLVRAAEAVARAVPGAVHRALAGQTHNVSPHVLAPAVLEFLDAGVSDARTRS
jgi:pimeloyl-ACP methyl ester carboxylesterase